MSLPVNNLARTLADIPIKAFVKEGNSVAINEKKIKFKLEFKANEAKVAYDEIVSCKSQQKSIGTNSNARSLHRKCKLKYNNTVNNSNTEKTDNKSVNINTLFKAIETGDMKFISQNFNSENVNICDQFGWTPLMSAAYSGHANIVDFLLKLKANIKLTDKSGFTALDLALKKNHTHVYDLIKHYVRKNRSEKTKKYEEFKDTRNGVQKTNQEGFYCDVCKVFFMESSRNKHESSTLHVFNSGPKIRNTFYGISKQNKGYQMLLNTGWDEENGLGPSGEGQKYPVKTVLKRDRRGLGQSNKNIARVTHFNSRDTDAVKYVPKDNKRPFNKKQWERQLRKDVVKTKLLRQALS